MKKFLILLILAFAAWGAVWLYADELQPGNLTVTGTATFNGPVNIAGPVASGTTLQVSGSYNASSGQLLLITATASNAVIVLPASQPEGVTVGVKLLAISGTWTASVQPGAGTYINLTGTSYPLTIQNQAAIFQYGVSGSSWTVRSDDIPANQVALKTGTYAALGAGTATTSGSATLSGSAAQANMANSATTSGSATLSGSAAQANLANSATTSGSATLSGSAAQANIANSATTSGSATLSGSAAQANTANSSTTSISSGTAASLANGLITGTTTVDSANDAHLLRSALQLRAGLEGLPFVDTINTSGTVGLRDDFSLVISATLSPGTFSMTSGTSWSYAAAAGSTFSEVPGYATFNNGTGTGFEYAYYPVSGTDGSFFYGQSSVLSATNGGAFIGWYMPGAWASDVTGAFIGGGAYDGNANAIGWIQQTMHATTVDSSDVLFSVLQPNQAYGLGSQLSVTGGTANAIFYAQGGVFEQFGARLGDVNKWFPIGYTNYVSGYSNGIAISTGSMVNGSEYPAFGMRGTNSTPNSTGIFSSMRYIPKGWQPSGDIKLLDYHNTNSYNGLHVPSIAHNVYGSTAVLWESGSGHTGYDQVVKVQVRDANGVWGPAQIIAASVSGTDYNAGAICDPFQDGSWMAVIQVSANAYTTSQSFLGLVLRSDTNGIVTVTGTHTFPGINMNNGQVGCNNGIYRKKMAPYKDRLYLSMSASSSYAAINFAYIDPPYTGNWTVISATAALGIAGNETSVVEEGGGTALAAYGRCNSPGYVLRYQSLDGGNTWSGPAQTTLPCPASRVMARELSDGHILITGNNHTGDTNREDAVSWICGDNAQVLATIPLCSWGHVGTVGGNMVTQYPCASIEGPNIEYAWSQGGHAIYYVKKRVDTQCDPMQEQNWIRTVNTPVMQSGSSGAVAINGPLSVGGSGSFSVGSGTLLKVLVSGTGVLVSGSATVTNPALVPGLSIIATSGSLGTVATVQALAGYVTASGTAVIVSATNTDTSTFSFWGWK